MALSDARPMLEGVRVVDLTTVVFGPYCTQILGDFGAEVIKVETPPAGDAFRLSGKSPNVKGMGPGHISLNRGKHSVFLNLKDPDDHRVMTDLLKTADVFVHNVREDAIGRLGFGYEAVKAANPGVIYVHCVGFGSNGPYAGLQAYDDVIQAATGTTSLASRVDGDPKPRFIPSLIADKVAGLHGAYATMAALVHKLRTGEGQFVEVPMFEAFASFLLKEHLAGLTFDPPQGGACYARQIDPHRQPFPTADGHVCIVPYTLPMWDTVFEILGEPSFLEDERFDTLRARVKHQHLLYKRLGEITATQPTAHWVEAFRGASIPIMPLREIDDVLDDPHLNASGFFERSAHPTEGGIVEMREPSRFSGWTPPQRRPAPTPGQDTEAVKRRAAERRQGDAD